MIRQIEKPKEIFCQRIKGDKWFFDEKNKLYFVENLSIKENNIYFKIYFDLESKHHRLDGPAEYYFDDNHNITYHFALYHYRWTPFQFAEKTNHLICLVCNKFCNQGCFL